MQGGAGSDGTLLDRTQGKRDRHPSENCGGSPGVAECCPGSKGGAQERQYQPSGRAPWPGAEPYELPACAMFFDIHEYAGGAQRSALDFQVPAVIVPSWENSDALCLEGRL